MNESAALDRYLARIKNLSILAYAKKYVRHCRDGGPLPSHRGLSAIGAHVVRLRIKYLISEDRARELRNRE